MSTEATLIVTKSILAKVQEQRGKLNSDTGRVFVGVKGSFYPDKLYHLEVVERDATEADDGLESFSLSAITKVVDKIPEGKVIDKTIPAPPVSGPELFGGIVGKGEPASPPVSG